MPLNMMLKFVLVIVAIGALLVAGWMTAINDMEGALACLGMAVLALFATSKKFD